MTHHKARRLQKTTRRASGRGAGQRPAAARCSRPAAVASLVSAEELKALMAVASGQDPAQTWER